MGERPLIDAILGQSFHLNSWLCSVFNFLAHLAHKGLVARHFLALIGHTVYSFLALIAYMGTLNVLAHRARRVHQKFGTSKFLDVGHIENVE